MPFLAPATICSISKPMLDREIVAALVEVLNAPTRPPALRPLARLKYPGRELQSQVNPDGAATVTLALYGWEYKHRGPRPKTPPPIDPVAVQAALNAALPDGLSVIAVQDHGTKITVKIKEEFR